MGVGREEGEFRGVWGMLVEFLLDLLLLPLLRMMVVVVVMGSIRGGVDIV
jgi:hypothetical protein